MRFVKTYNDFKLDCKLELKPGTITALIGRNGSGKTTLFKLYLGLIEDDDKHTNQVNKEEIGVVWNDSSFSLVLNVLEIKKILMYSYKHFDCDYFDSMISRFELDPKKPLKEYSTGMLSKLKIIIATSLRAKTLLLDEPTSGLDVIARNEVLDLLRDYMEQNEEASILISSHIASDLEGLCDEFYFIEKGKIILQEQDLESYALLKGVDETVDLSYALKKIGSTYLTNERQFINAYKSASSRLIKKEYPEIRQKLWKEMFWSQSFCLLSAGGAPIEVIRQYIETQGENKSEHRVPFSDLPE